jgi:hypothetical protein
MVFGDRQIFEFLNPTAKVAMEKGMAAASTIKETSPVIDASLEERIRLFKLDSTLGILIIEKKFFFIMVMNILVRIPMNVNTLELPLFFLEKNLDFYHSSISTYFHDFVIVKTLSDLGRFFCF